MPESWTVGRPPLSRLQLTLIVAGILAAAHLLPLAWTYSYQDDCSFGPVTNARYRELLAEARRKDATVWPPLEWHPKAREQLQLRLNDLVGESASVYERLAAMHAVMRALGGEYRRTGHDADDPYEKAARGGGIVFFDYHLDLNRIGFFRPVRRTAWMSAGLAVSENAKGPFQRTLSPGAIFFTVNFPHWLETYVTVPRSQFGTYCPRMPTATTRIGSLVQMTGGSHGSSDENFPRV